jgi:hypothetical protein
MEILLVLFQILICYWRNDMFKFVELLKQRPKIAFHMFNRNCFPNLNNHVIFLDSKFLMNK